MAVAWVADLTNRQQTADQQAMTFQVGVAVAAGRHVVIQAIRGARGSADTVASVSSSASGAVGSVDHAGIYMSDKDVSTAVVSVYFPNGAASTDTITITWTGASAFNFWASRGSVYSGMATSTWKDGSSSGSGFGTALGTGLTGATTANGLAFGGFTVDGSTFTAGAGYTARGSLNDVANSGVILYSEDKTTTSGSTYDATATLAANQSWTGQVVTYKEAGAGGGAPVNTAAPAISGNPWNGQTLTCSQGSWSNSPTGFAYQWKRGATNIGTNSNTYTLVGADVGQSITCVVTASNASGSASANSNTVTTGASYTLALLHHLEFCSFDVVTYTPGSVAGSTVVLSYSGSAPDIGAIESNPQTVSTNIIYHGIRPDIGAVESVSTIQANVEIVGVIPI